jgi:hypothetical protein
VKPDQLDPKTLARIRRDAMRLRARRIRRSVTGLALALFTAAFVGIYVQLAAGHDPALSKRQTTTTTAAKSEAESSTSSGETASSESSSSGSEETSGSETSATGSEEATESPSAVTTRQS